MSQCMNLGWMQIRIVMTFLKNIPQCHRNRRDIRKGEVLSEKNITTKRPGNGMSPMEWYSVIGTAAVRDFREDELIEVL